MNVYEFVNLPEEQQRNNRWVPIGVLGEGKMVSIPVHGLFLAWLEFRIWCYEFYFNLIWLWQDIKNDKVRMYDDI